MSLITVEAGLQILFRKMVALHKKIDPNLSEEFYLERLRSFTQPQLLIDDILFVFDSFSEKMQQVATDKSQEDIRREKLEKLIESNDALARRHTKVTNYYKQTQQPTAGRKEQSVERLRPYPTEKRSVDIKDQQLKERDLNLIKRSSNLTKGKVLRFEYGRTSPKARPMTLQSAKSNIITENTESNLKEPSPFQDFSIYQGTKEVQKQQQKSITLRGDRSRRNSKVAAITLIRNSFKVW